MSAPVFLLGAARGARVGDRLVLSGDEGRHAVTVRRLGVGEPVELVDGTGTRACGSVVGILGRDRLEVDVQRVEVEPPAAPRVTVVQGIPKGERGELAVETLTEVGVDVIVPWAADRCVAQWRGEKVMRGEQKWRRTAQEAGKQARRSWLPEVLGLADTADVVTLLAASSCAVVLHEAAQQALSSSPLPGSGDIVLIVGPEGGITDHELTAFAAAGAHACRLGASVLRTSSAGAVAAALVMAATGRWS
jgi:16S rRNA (uracil1498-N3)-methyltransferase